MNSDLKREIMADMLQEWIILLVSFCYLSILFAIAYFGDKRADSGRSIISNPYIYTLSIAVYCTAWTFYGSVGRAAQTGVGFLPIYLGPTLIAVLWWTVLRKIIRITKVHRITTIADFISSRYGKSSLLGGLVTIIAVVGIMPYISLQLKAVSTSFNVLHMYSESASDTASHITTWWKDTALYVAMIMALFSILFGTRHIDATERHEGMVAAIAFESVVKLLAFTSVGIFVTFVLFSGPGELFGNAMKHQELKRLIGMEAMTGGYTSWLTLTFLSMIAIMFLPRQFQVLVVENVNEAHLRKATWLFPLYLLAINLFVLPISFAGLLHFPGGAVDPDTFVLTLPLAQHQEFLAMFVFLGGLSAATGMVIVATIALSTMLCNDLVIPVLLRIRKLRSEDLSRVLISIRRGSIIGVLLLGYLFFRFTGESYALVTIGLMSFAAAAQFAPPILIGIYWKGASMKGAIVGLLGGFMMWAYTLLLPSFAKSGWISASFLSEGPLGIKLLAPYALFGLDMFDPLTHSVFWSMLVNVGFLICVSLFDRQGTFEQLQAKLFVDVFSQGIETRETRLWSGTSSVAEIKDLVTRLVGQIRAERAFAGYERNRGVRLDINAQANADLVEFAERELSGAIGAASARVMVSSVVKGEALSMEGVMKILDEASQVIEYSHKLEQKSRELEEATKELREANERLKELDRMKDEFVSIVSHELRTPLTSIRALTEILHDNPELEREKRQQFLGNVVKESERLSRLINQVLDMAKIEAETAEWTPEQVDLRELIEEGLVSTNQLFIERSVALNREMPPEPVLVTVDRDRLVQVVINLLSNAVKFCKKESGLVKVRILVEDGAARVEVTDNGPGIPHVEQEKIFNKFHQIKDRTKGKPMGSGLGLSISQRIIEHHGGKIWVESGKNGGATFIFTLPRSDSKNRM
jgi:Na+/proline symporter/nitrogen-specific signal transduction histidine kinase